MAEVGTLDLLRVEDLFSSEERQVRDATRQFLTSEAAPFVSEWWEQGIFPVQLVPKLGALGLFGANLSLSDETEPVSDVAYGLIMYELERVDSGLRSFASVQGALVMYPIHRYGSDEQKARYLPKLASGEMIGCFGLTEHEGGSDPASMKTTARKDGAEYVLNGTKMFVEFASAADRVLVVARTGGAPTANDGLAMFLVNPNDVNVRLESLSTMSRDRQFQMVLDGVRVEADDVIGTPGEAWSVLEGVIERGVVALCAYMVGAAERIHEMTTAFAKERVQFNRPIGSFQAIQHYLAQSITEILAADTMMFYAAWTLDEGLPSREIVAKAKAFAGDTFRKASDLGAQIHGGIGYDESMDTTLFLRRGKQLQLSMGGTGYWEDVIAEELLGPVEA